MGKNLLAMYREDRRVQSFGWLKVIDWSERPGWWVCKCVCCDLREVIEQKLVSGEVVECVSCDRRRKMAQCV